MKFHKQDIDGVWLIETEPVVDNRGAFHRHFCIKEFEQIGLQLRMVVAYAWMDGMCHPMKNGLL